MKSKINCIGIIRESRHDEARAPLSPEQINLLTKKYPKIKFIVQPSKLRSFQDINYKKNGAHISEDLNECDLILGIKEIDPKFLLEKKTYIFFSHTFKLNKETLKNAQGTPGMDKKKLLKKIIDYRIKLIDYENLRSKVGARYLGFGRFAGVVGCYNTLNLFLKNHSIQKLERAYEINDYVNLKKILNKVVFPKFKLLVTGDGRVANGVLEVLKETNIKKINKYDFLNNEFEYPVFCNLKTKDYISHKNKKSFDLHHFIKYPNEYSSISIPYLKKTDVFISAHYWDPSSPKIFEKNDLENLLNLKVIGDITCDIDGSVPTTIRSSTIKKPNYYLDRKFFKESKKNKNNISVMAVDNLPSELPKDSSIEFGENIINHLLPYLIDRDDGRVLNATITENGYFLKKYNYLNDYLNS